uniref:Uncharacterized protein n=1 Tax=Streptomyces avermitilis TaxID=33903 RepID=A0A499VUF8_STRAX|nr:hypothetical protein SAVMC3_27460 [Streptomyces avermitilis]
MDPPHLVCAQLFLEHGLGLGRQHEFHRTRAVPLQREHPARHHLRHVRGRGLGYEFLPDDVQQAQAQAVERRAEHGQPGRARRRRAQEALGECVRRQRNPARPGGTRQASGRRDEYRRAAVRVAPHQRPGPAAQGVRGEREDRDGQPGVFVRIRRHVQQGWWLVRDPAARRARRRGGEPHGGQVEAAAPPQLGREGVEHRRGGRARPVPQQMPHLRAAPGLRRAVRDHHDQAAAVRRAELTGSVRTLGGVEGEVRDLEGAEGAEPVQDRRELGDRLPPHLHAG